jgi:hypothetical protein
MQNMADLEGQLNEVGVSSPYQVLRPQASNSNSWSEAYSSLMVDFERLRALNRPRNR